MGRLVVCLLAVISWLSLFALSLGATEKQQISFAQITQVAQSYLQKTIPLQDINLQLKSKLPDQLVPQGKIELKVKPLNSRKGGGHRAVPVQILVDGKIYRTLILSFNVQILQEVVVLVQPLKKGETISGAKVVLQRVDVSRLHSSPYQGIEQVMGSRATRYLKANTILTKKDLEEIPLVLKGKPVTIQAKIGLVEIAVLGKALADGRRGELIQVQNLDSGKKLLVRVVGSALTEIPNKN